MIRFTGPLIILLIAGCALNPKSPAPAPDLTPSVGQLSGLVEHRFSHYDNASDGGHGALVHHFVLVSNRAEGDWLWHQRRYPGGERSPSRWIAYPLVSLDQAAPARLIADGQLPASLAGPTPWPDESYQALPQCLMGWKPTQNGWQLSSTESGCVIAGSDVSHQQLLFDATGLTWSSSRSAEAAGHKQRYWPVEDYQGWIGFRDRLSVEAERWQRLPDIRLSDTGERYRLTIPVSQRVFNIELRRQHYPGSERQLLQLKVIEDGELVASAWAPPGVKQIGLHLPWLQVGLRRAGD